MQNDKIEIINTNILYNSMTNILPWLFVILGALFYCYEYFLRIVPGGISAQLMNSYNISIDDFGKLVSYYYLSYTPLQLFVGSLMDRFGTKKLLTVAMFTCVIGTIIFAGTNNLIIAKFGRFLMGAGSAFAFVGTLQIASTWLPRNRFGIISGSLASIGTLGAIAGDFILTSIVKTVGWRHMLYSTAIFGILLATLMLIFLRDKNNNKINDDNSAKKIVPNKLISTKKIILSGIKLLKNPTFIINGLIGAFLYSTLSVFADLWGLPYLNHVNYISKIQAVGIISFIFLGWTIGGPIWGFFTDYLKKRKIVLLLGVSLSIIFVIMIVLGHNWSLNHLRIIFFMFGFSSSVQAICFPIGRELASPRITGTAISLTNMLIMLGPMFLQPLIGNLLNRTKIIHNHIHVNLFDYNLAMLLFPIIFVIALILAFFLKETYNENS